MHQQLVGLHKLSTPARLCAESGPVAQVITATPRQLESSVRLAEALAKMRLSPTVEAEDVQEGFRLMKVRQHLGLA